MWNKKFSINRWSEDVRACIPCLKIGDAQLPAVAYIVHIYFIWTQQVNRVYLRFMNFRRKPINIKTFISCIFLMMTLASLTVSLPYVYGAKKLLALDSSAISFPIEETDCESDNPFANTTEEKTSNNISTASEEYLHETHSAEEYLAALSREYKIEHTSVYIAFYGDLISPPPDAA